MLTKIHVLYFTLTWSSLLASIPYKVYWAGDLFDHKDLIGNLLLATCLEKKFPELYKVHLPQDYENHENDSTPVDIRNSDIKLLMESDLALFNFDGPDLDSGTCIEFVLAKMLDIPAVIVRTDFRTNADAEGGLWNLMAHGFPRTEIVHHHALRSYQQDGITKFHDQLAHDIHHAFMRALNEPSLFKTEEEVRCAYNLVVKNCGGNLDCRVCKERQEELIKNKIQKTVYKGCTLN